MTLGEKLKALRTSAGLTQKQLAEKVGVSDKSLGYYETNERTPRKNTIASISEYFNVPAEFLTQESEDDFEKLAQYADRESGKAEADRIIKDVQGLFAGGKLSEEDRDAVMLTLQNIYWEVKAKQNKDK
jgi:transcriptional regulator with XRE-family HTH domain